MLSNSYDFSYLNNNRENQSDNSHNDNNGSNRDELYGISYDINISDYENNHNDYQYRFDNHYTESIDDSRQQNIIARDSRSQSFDRNEN